MSTTVNIKSSKTTVASVIVAPSSNISLGTLTNVDVANITDGQGLIYSAANGKFESGAVTATVTQLTGGRF